MMFVVWFCLFSMEFTLLKFYTLMERSISFDIKRSVVTEIEEEKCRWTGSLLFSILCADFFPQPLTKIK